MMRESCPTASINLSEAARETRKGWIWLGKMTIPRSGSTGNVSGISTLLRSSSVSKRFSLGSAISSLRSRTVSSDRDGKVAFDGRDLLPYYKHWIRTRHFAYARAVPMDALVDF